MYVSSLHVNYINCRQSLITAQLGSLQITMHPSGFLLLVQQSPAVVSAAPAALAVHLVAQISAAAYVAASDYSDFVAVAAASGTLDDSDFVVAVAVAFVPFAMPQAKA